MSVTLETISQLPAVVTPAITDVYAVQQLDGTTRQATPAQITAFEQQRALAAEASISATASAALATANNAQPKIDAAASSLMLAPATYGAQPGALPPSTAGQLPIANGTSWAPQTVSGDCTLAASGAMSVTKTGGVAFSSLATAAPGVGLTVSGGSADVEYGTTAGTALQGSLLGSASGVAPLDSTSKVPLTNLPSVAVQAGIQSQSAVLAGPISGSGAAAFRVLAYGDISGLGSAAQLTAGGPNGAAVLDSQGNASAFDVLSAGSTTARTLASRGADWVNVKDYGAVLNGSSSDSAVFQNVYNTVANNGIVDIPGGGFYLGTALTQSTTKSILWRNLGALDYGTSAPGTNPVGSIGDGDVLETFLAGRKRFSKTITNNTVSTEGALEVNTVYNAWAPGNGTLSSMNVSVTNNISSGGSGTNGILSTVTVNGSQGSGGNLSFFGNAVIAAGATASAAPFYGQTHDNPGSFGSVGCMELDLFTWNDDPIINATPFNSMRGLVLIKANVLSGKSVSQAGRGITVATDGTAQIGAAYTGEGTLYYAAFDAASFSSTGTSYAALRAAPGVAIDLSAVTGTASSVNERTLGYYTGSTAFEYQVSGVALFTVTDAGEVTTKKNILDDGSGNALIAGSPTINKGIINGATLTSNASTITIPSGVSKVFCWSSSATAITIDAPPSLSSNQFFDIEILFADSISVSFVLPSGVSFIGGSAPSSVTRGQALRICFVSDTEAFITSSLA